MTVDAAAQDGLFGRLAVHQRLITMEQLAQATSAQSRDSGRRPLGELLIELGYLTADQTEELLRHQKDILGRRAQDERDRHAALLPRAIELPASASAISRGAVPPADPFARQNTLAISVDVVEEVRAVIAREGGTLKTVDPLAEARAWVTSVLAAAVTQQASDVHIHTDEPVRMRRFGQLVPVTSQPLPATLTSLALQALLPANEQKKLEQHGQVDCGLTVPGVGRFRANFYRQLRGIDGVFRVVKPRPPTLSELSLPASLARLTTFSQGIVLCTGPAASGKSATLAALVHMINEERAEHVVTIEDPIEVLHPSIRCVVNQREAGRHTLSFARALRAALREDPDVIVVGELRDRETVHLALTAAETGHLVLATLNTHSAVRTINRLIGEFPPSQQPGVRAMLSESLRAIISQRLLPRKDGHGVVPAVEVLMATPAVQNLIRDSRVHQIRSAMQTGLALGMQTLDASLLDLVARDVVDKHEARRHAEDGKSVTGEGTAVTGLLRGGA